MAKVEQTLAAGEVASRSGVSKDTLRHYERIGILAAPPRSEGGYRLYSAEHVERVRLVQRALGIGFGLRELSEFLGIRDSRGAPCRKVRDALAKKRDELDRKLAELHSMRDELTGILSDWDARLREVPPGDQARLFDSLSASSPRPPRKPK